MRLTQSRAQAMDRIKVANSLSVEHGLYADVGRPPM